MEEFDEAIKNAEVVLLDLPEEMTEVPTTYDADALSSALKTVPVRFLDTNNKMIDLNLYYEAAKVVVATYEKVVLSPENKPDFEKVRSQINKNIKSLEILEKDIKSKVETALYEKIEKLIVSKNILKKLEQDVFKNQIDGFEDLLRNQKIENIVIPCITQTAEVYKVESNLIEEQLDNKKTDRVTYRKFLSNATTTDKEIKDTIILLAKNILDQRAKNQDIINRTKEKNSFTLTQLELANTKYNTKISILDLDIVIKDTTTHDEIKDEIKRALAKIKSTEKETQTTKKSEKSEPKTILIDSCRLEDVDALKIVYAFAVGFKDEEERKDFTSYLGKYPKWKELYKKIISKKAVN